MESRFIGAPVGSDCGPSDGVLSTHVQLCPLVQRFLLGWKAGSAGFFDNRKILGLPPLLWSLADKILSFYSLLTFIFRKGYPGSYFTKRELVAY